MPRKTKAQKMAELAAIQQQQAEQLIKDYFPNLMSLMERASNVYADISVQDGKFIVSLHGVSAGAGQRYHDPQNQFMFSAQYDKESQDFLYTLEYTLERIEQQRAEAERKIKLRNEALAKLSDEERAALGL